MNIQKQFIADLKILKVNKKMSEEMIADAMANALGGEISGYRDKLMKYTLSPHRISAFFVRDFYKVFQADLDKIKGMSTLKASSKPQTKEDTEVKYIVSLEKTNDQLLRQVEQLTELNRELLERIAQLTNQVTELVNMVLDGGQHDGYADPSPQ